MPGFPFTGAQQRLSAIQQRMQSPYWAGSQGVGPPTMRQGGMTPVANMLRNPMPVKPPAPNLDYQNDQDAEMRKKYPGLERMPVMGGAQPQRPANMMGGVGQAGSKTASFPAMGGYRPYRGMERIVS